MIVDRTTLDVAPVSDRLLTAVAGELTNETEQGAIAWSNELALHVIELKTNGPAPHLKARRRFSSAHVHAHQRHCSSQWNACLMPTGVHPWMDPDTRDAPLAARRQRDLRGVRPHLRLPRPRLVEPAEHAHQPAVRRRRGVRPAARGDPARAADAAGARRELAVSRRPRDRTARRAPRCVRAQPGARAARSPAASFRSRANIRAEYQRADSRADVSRHRAARPRRASCSTSG